MINPEGKPPVTLEEIDEKMSRLFLAKDLVTSEIEKLKSLLPNQTSDQRIVTQRLLDDNLGHLKSIDEEFKRLAFEVGRIKGIIAG